MKSGSRLTGKARAVFEQRQRQLCRELSPCGKQAAFDFRPAWWVTLEILQELLADGRVPAAGWLRKVARQRLTAKLFVGEGGDPVVDPHHQLSIDQQTRLVVAVLEQTLPVGFGQTQRTECTLSQPS